jgi:hypothetical protein
MDCKWTTAVGPCTQPALPGEKFCERHTEGGTQKIIKHYLLTQKWMRDPAERHLQVDELKSLREEIMIARVLVETRLNMCKSEAELVAAMPSIQGYLNTIEKVVISCHTMETKLGQMLNKSAIMSIAQKIVTMIDTNLKGISDHDAIVEKIGLEIVEIIAEQENQ